MDDGSTLYAALDFTPDNTVDGDTDFVAICINTAEGLTRYQVSESEKTWGTSGFTYTARVGYQHKVYEFAFPFSEIGMDESTESIKISFEAYGTAYRRGLLFPDAVYNDLKNEYLVVYGIDDETDRDGSINDFNIMAEIFEYTGTTTGTTTRVADISSSGRTIPTMTREPWTGKSGDEFSMETEQPSATNSSSQIPPTTEANTAIFTASW